jgi:hypothetical protein
MWANDNELIMSMFDRTENEVIPYDDMPETLGKYHYFIDRHRIQSLSKTALESLAMGLTVIDWKGKELMGLPDKHDPYNVAKRTIEIYDKILSG